MIRKICILFTALLILCCFNFSSDAGAKERSVIIRFHRQPGISEETLVHGAKGRIKHKHRLIPAITAHLPEERIADLAKDPRVAYIVDDNVVKAVEPLPGIEYQNSWGVEHIGAGLVHETGNKGAGVKIAVLDTGIDYTHPDLVDNFKGGDNFVQYDTPPADPHDPFDDSGNGHGTHIAGIVAAKQNGAGVVGVAPEAEIYAVKVLDGARHGLDSWIIAGIEWAVSNGMQIINMSLEGGYNPAVEEACNAAYASGVLLIAAAGNSGTISYPAMYDSVVAVTATNPNDTKASFTPIDPKIELAAPGVNVMSTVPSDVISTIGVSGYDLLSGTSQAAPHVAGTAALILASGNLEDLNNDGKVNNEDLRLKLQMSSSDLGVQGKDTTFGFGLVNAAKAVVPKEQVEHLTITETSKQCLDAETVSLLPAQYHLTVNNHGLSTVTVVVVENGTHIPKLCSTYCFMGKRPQQINFDLNIAANSDITFIPSGKKGASADITIEKN